MANLSIAISRPIPKVVLTTALCSLPSLERAQVRSRAKLDCLPTLFPLALSRAASLAVLCCALLCFALVCLVLASHYFYQPSPLSLDSSRLVSSAIFHYHSDPPSFLPSPLLADPTVLYCTGRQASRSTALHHLRIHLRTLSLTHGSYTVKLPLVHFSRLPSVALTRSLVPLPTLTKLCILLLPCTPHDRA